MNKRLTLRIVTASIAMVTGLGVTAALGLWQYTVAHRDDIAREVMAAPSINFESVSTLGTYVDEKYYGQLVSLDANLKCTQSFVVKPIDTSWQVCPATLVDGTNVAVVVDVSDVTPKFSGIAQIQGRLQPAQEAVQLAADYQPRDVASAINTDDLVLRWKTDVRDGYIAAESITLNNEVASHLTKIPTNEIVTPPVGIDIRNLFYAWQWWVFGSFVFFLYIRFVRDEVRLARQGSPSTEQ